MAETNDRTHEDSSGRAAGCIVASVVLLLLLIVGGVGGGIFFFRQAKRRQMLEEMRMQQAEMAARAEAERRHAEALREEERAKQEAQPVTPELSQPNPQTPPLRPRGAFPADLVRIVRGDTLILRVEGTEVTVGLIGLHAPTTDTPGYVESCDELKSLCTNCKLYLLADPEVDHKDAEGRSLFWLWAGSKLVNLELLRQGRATLLQEHGLGRYEQALRAAAR